MKKILMATTAVAGMAAFATTASAQDALELSFGGMVKYEYHFYDNERDINGVGTEPVNDAGLGHGLDNGDTFVTFTAAGTADNGLGYVAYIDLDMTAGDAGADEAHIQFSGNWGLVRIGDNDGAEDSHRYGAENILVATGGFDGDAADYWNLNGVGTDIGSGAQGFEPNLAGDSSDASKILYQSPNFSGFQASASFAPDDGGFSNRANRGGGTAQRNIMEVGARYSGNFDAVSVTVGAGYLHSTPDNATGTEDTASWSIGAGVGFGGFNVAASYGDHGESGCATGAAGANCDAGDYWNIGVSYGAGPWAVSAGYHEAEGNRDGNARDSQAEILSIGGAYTIAQGLSAYAEYNDGEFTNGANNTSVDNQSFILGTAISF